MKKKQAATAFQRETNECSSSEVWISKNNELDEEIDKKAQEFLLDLEKSKESNRLIVGWRPE